MKKNLIYTLLFIVTMIFASSCQEKCYTYASNYRIKNQTLYAKYYRSFNDFCKVKPKKHKKPTYKTHKK